MPLIDPRESRELPSTHKESLPLPYVHYSGLYSTFVRFSSEESDETFLCECSRTAAENYSIDLISSLGGNPPWSITALGCLINRSSSQSSGTPEHFTSADEILPHLRFKEGLCHRCNQAVPSIDYGYELCFKHTSFFTQRFGFYVQQWLLSKGFNGWGDPIPGVLTATDVSPLLSIDTHAARKLLSQCSMGRTFPDEDGPVLAPSEERLLREKLRIQRLAVCTFAELQIREEFGFPNRGKLAQAEYMLFLILCRIFGKNAVTHRSRPEWLGGMELDVHIPSAGIACEYQGHQHSTPKSFMHSSPNSFSGLKSRDAKKEHLCQENGLRLLYFHECDYLTEELVRSRLSQSGHHF